MACTRDSTSSTNASGNSRIVSNRGAANSATTARPAPAPNEMARRNPPRSSSGTITGAANASGAIVSPRYSATLTLAWPTGIEKNTESARAIATIASPATLAMWTSVYVSSGSSLRHIRWTGRVATPNACPSPTSARAATSSAPDDRDGLAPDTSRRSGGRSGRGSRPTALGGEPVTEQLLHELRVGRVAGLLHDLPDQESDRVLLAPAKLRHRVRVLGDDLVDHGAERGRVAHMATAPRLDDVLGGVAGGECLGQHGLRPGRRHHRVAHEPGQVCQVLRRQLAELELGTRLVHQRGDVLGQPVGGLHRWRPQPHRLLEELGGRARPRQQSRLLGLQLVLLDEPPALRGRELGQGRPDLLDPLRRRFQRREVGLREVPVVERELLAAQGIRGTAVLVPVPGLLDERPAGLQDFDLAGRLVAQRTLHRPDRVEVLDLDLRAELGGTGGPDADVRVAPHWPLLHAHVADAQCLQGRAQLGDVRPGLLRAADVRLAHDLDERNPRPVVVDQRVLCAGDAPGLAGVRGLPRVLLHVDAGDADAPRLAVGELDVQVPADADRQVVLRDLEVLRHVRIEVVLPVEQRVGRDPRP